ncbi:MAG TPA: hypothetical protein VGM37_21390 [Armatimonadota bacterium]|jgi:hypothetical protein
MLPEPVWLGETACISAEEPVVGGFCAIDGQRYARIANVDRLAPFLISVVSCTDLWLFAGSNGPFTAGRVDPNGAIFPYRTADKLLSHSDTSGAHTTMLVLRNGHRRLWEPWQPSGLAYRIRRSLYKHVHGASIVFEEENEDLGLSFQRRLSACEPYGIVCECRLLNTGAEPADVRYLDGWRQLSAPGVSQETYSRYSYLAEGYMRHERAPGHPLGMYTLNAGISDTAEPSEMLRATAAWSLGHDNPTILLSDRQTAAFRRGEPVSSEDEVRGETGAFLVADKATIPPGEARAWVNAVDTNLDHEGLIRLLDELDEPECLAPALQQSIAANHDGIRRLIAGADGLQQSADEAASVHHFSNALFNCLRGGAFGDSYRAPKADLRLFLRSRSRAVAERRAAWLDALPEELTLPGFQRAAAETGDAQLIRLAREYLPLTFSRRHGDPSRPWNHFSIHVKDAAGRPVYGYQGNWRDIFQNWEGLALSYPEALDSMIAVFLNASTADGHNPYRITREGIDWEVHDKADPWSNIGYWGDHQIVYLLRLLEASERYHPGRLAAGLREEVFSYANVPYEIAGFDAMVRDPRHTIAFNHDLHERVMLRSATEGADAKLLADPEGDVLLVSLAEKLLVPLLAKLTSFVPGGGIWLNTQRPEWNDANNALAGWGLSVVTVQYLRRYLAFLDGVLAGAAEAPVSVSTPVAALLRRLAPILAGAGSGLDDGARFAAMRELGYAGEEYRNAVYREGLRGRADIAIGEIRSFIAAALGPIEQTIRANRAADGLTASYNVLHIEDGRAEVKGLFPMLEGQVAALSSGLLTPEESAALLRALRTSDLYREDQKSYMLYPDREMKPFLTRNALPHDATQMAPVLNDLLAAQDRSLAAPDSHGRWRFSADLCNARDLTRRLNALAADATWSAAVERDRQAILDLWEAVFRHNEFTGRSGTFFMFEGLGSVYWHMVAKLLVAVQETWRRAVDGGADPRLIEELAERYRDVRDGLGFRKTPAEYGAFPTDPYSHTPRNRGAQQPGMTGQVKEEIITRLGELGVEVSDGCLRFLPRLLQPNEFSPSEREFRWVDVAGEERTCRLPANSLAFTVCQVPVVYTLDGLRGITVWRSGRADIQPEAVVLTPEDSAAIFARTGEVDLIRVKCDEIGVRVPDSGFRV